MALKRVSNSTRSTAPPPSSASIASFALNLSAEHELVLLESLLANKLAGMHKHFRMVVVTETINRALLAADLGRDSPMFKNYS
jgi:hypothetical protein